MAAVGTAAILFGLRFVPVPGPYLNLAINGFLACAGFFTLLAALDRSGDERRLARWIWSQIIGRARRRGPA